MSHLLSVIIPCYNEKQTIAQIINAIRECPIDNIEIIVVNDASTDGTKELLESSLKSEIDLIVHHECNRGKGAAIRSGISKASGHYIIIQDADLEYSPQDYPRLMQPFLDGKADVVYGSRFCGGDVHRVLYFWHFVGNKFLTLLCNMTSNLNLTDMETCYKAFRREIIQHVTIEENRFGFEPEITIKLSRVPGIKFYEVGISYSGRTYQEGKKIGWKDGIRAIYCIIKYGILFRSKLPTINISDILQQSGSSQYYPRIENVDEK